MIISEVNALASLVQKATSFVIQLEERRYKGEINLKAFRDKVWMLSAKHAEWSHQLQRYGVSEDEHLLKLVAAAETHLDELEKYVQRLKSNRFLRWKKKVFPEQLDYYLSMILEIVDAGPQVLATKIGYIQLLETNAMYTPASLPFRRDENYVPIRRSVLDLQRALEDVEGKQVVTVHAGPQSGKTSLVKHVALNVEERRIQGMNTSFPDGVYYLHCGQKAKNKVEQLQLELLHSLGFGTALPNDIMMAGGLQGQLHKMKLTSRLENKKLLIILDDLWDEEVLEELLVPSKGVRYLVTSQNEDIWIPARKVELQMPTEEEGVQILANYVEGLPTTGKLADVQTWSHSIVRMVEMHPKVLTNIGLSMSSQHARNVRFWEDRALATEFVCRVAYFTSTHWTTAIFHPATLYLWGALPRMSSNNMLDAIRSVQRDRDALIITAFFLFSLHILTEFKGHWSSVQAFRQNAVVSSILGLPYGRRFVLFIFLSIWGRFMVGCLFEIAMVFRNLGTANPSYTLLSLAHLYLRFSIFSELSSVCRVAYFTSTHWTTAIFHPATLYLWGALPHMSSNNMLDAIRSVQRDRDALIITAFFLFSLHILTEFKGHWSSVQAFRQNAVVSSILGLPYRRRLVLFIFLSIWGRFMAGCLFEIAMVFRNLGTANPSYTLLSLAHLYLRFSIFSELSSVNGAVLNLLGGHIFPSRARAPPDSMHRLSQFECLTRSVTKIVSFANAYHRRTALSFEISLLARKRSEFASSMVGSGRL